MSAAATTWINLSLTAIATIVAVVALIRSRRIAELRLDLDDLQAKLAKKQLQKLHQTEQQAQVAEIDVELVNVGGSCDFELRITNLGAADASNVTIEWVGETLQMMPDEVENRFPIKRLRPQKQVRVTAPLHMGSPNNYQGKVSWANPDGNTMTDDFELHTI